MSQSVAEFVDTIDGVRGGVADAVGQRYGTVADLSGAETASLTEVKGIGPVLAERIADHTPPQEPDPSPATRARATVEQARAATRPDLDVIDGDGAPASTDRPHADLPVLVERLATLVGTTIGWGIRVYRTVTRPAQRLLHR
jgi:hypothetical protein